MKRKLIAIITSTVALTIALVSLSVGKPAIVAPNAKALVGTWERFSMKDKEGKAFDQRVIPAFVIFSADGHFSQTQFPAGRAKTDKPVKELSKEELLDRLDGASAFYGTYTVTGNKLTRKELSALNPNSEGRDVIQNFRLEGDVLFLTPTTSTTYTEVRWRRVK